MAHVEMIAATHFLRDSIEHDINITEAVTRSALHNSGSSRPGSGCLRPRVLLIAHALCSTTA